MWLATRYCHSQNPTILIATMSPVLSSSGVIAAYLVVPGCWRRSPTLCYLISEHLSGSCR